MDIDSVTIDENGRYITLELPMTWDLASLERSFRKVKVIGRSMKVNNLLIKSEHCIFNKTMTELLDISILFSEFIDGFWKIAIVSKDVQDDLRVFESSVALYDLKTNDFKDVLSAEAWF